MHVIDNNEDVFVVPGLTFLGTDRAVVIMTVLLELYWTALGVRDSSSARQDQDTCMLSLITTIPHVPPMRLNQYLCIAQGHNVCCEFQSSHMFESTSQQRLQTLRM